jgi:hypothetical protein
MARDPKRSDTPPAFDDDTEQELRDAAAITPDDLTRAQAAWRRDARPAFRALLDAQPAERKPAGPPTPPAKP